MGNLPAAVKPYCEQCGCPQNVVDRTEQLNEIRRVPQEDSSYGLALQGEPGFPPALEAATAGGVPPSLAGSAAASPGVTGWAVEDICAQLEAAERSAYEAAFARFDDDNTGLVALEHVLMREWVVKHSGLDETDLDTAMLSLTDSEFLDRTQFVELLRKHAISEA